MKTQIIGLSTAFAKKKRGKSARGHGGCAGSLAGQGWIPGGGLGSEPSETPGFA